MYHAHLDRNTTAKALLLMHSPRQRVGIPRSLVSFSAMRNLPTTTALLWRTHVLSLQSLISILHFTCSYL